MKSIVSRLAFAICVLPFVLPFCLPCGPAGSAIGQEYKAIELRLQPKAINRDIPSTRLMTPFPDRIPGNAALTLLRLPHSRIGWLVNEQPKLTEDFYGRDYDDPILGDFWFDSFAEQIISAGEMSHADWGYPLNSSRPYDILLPDAQEMRSYLGYGMTVWIKQRLAKGELGEALQGIRAQLNCAKHLSSTPLIVCHVMGLVVANQALDNIQLLMQHPDNTENYYWALSRLPVTLGDLKAAAEWEQYAKAKMLPSLTDPWPSRGSEQWVQIAREFSELEAYFPDLDSPETPAEKEARSAVLDKIASQYLTTALSWTAEELNQASREERILRWQILQRQWFDVQAERVSVLPPAQALQVHIEMETRCDAIKQEINSPAEMYIYSGMGGNGMIFGYRFHRRVCLLQTIEALRDYAFHHDGQFPESLAELNQPAPNDPLLNQPFEYQKSGNTAWLTAIDLPANADRERKYRLSLAR